VLLSMGSYNVASPQGLPRLLRRRARQRPHRSTVVTEIIRGTIHGKTIDLDKNPGMPDGQKAAVILRPEGSAGQWGEGIRRSAGALADCPEMDAFMEEIQQERRRATLPGGSSLPS
jgi:hypothetical protein